MKIWIFVLFILFLNGALAADIDINIQRDAYKVGETVIFEVVSNVDLVDPISISQIRLYDNLNNRQSIALNFIKINENRYYGYFDVPQVNAGNYSLSLNSVEYFKEGKLKRESFSNNLDVIYGLDNVLSVFPGAYYKRIENWEQPWMDFKLKNKGNNSLSFTPQVSDSFLSYDGGLVQLVPGKEEDIRLESNVKGINQKIIGGKFLISGYEIPIIFEKTVVEEENKTVVNETIVNKTVVENITITEMNFTLNETIPENITVVENVTLSEDSLHFNETFEDINQELSKIDTVEGAISFRNNATVTLYNITIELTNGLEEITKLDKTFVEVLEPGQTDIVGIRINFDHNITRNYKGELVIKSVEGVEDRMPISLTYISLEVECSLDTDCDIGTCIDNKCVAGTQVVEVECVEDIECGDGKSCVNGKCLIISDVNKSEGTNWVIWAVLGGVVLLGIFVLYFYNKAQKKSYTEVKSRYK